LHVTHDPRFEEYVHANYYLADDEDGNTAHDDDDDDDDYFSTDSLPWDEMEEVDDQYLIIWKKTYQIMKKIPSLLMRTEEF
jgi:hypothetical protein